MCLTYICICDTINTNKIIYITFTFVFFMPDKGVDLFFPWNVRLAHFEGYNTVLATWTVTIYPLSSVSPSGHRLVLVNQSFILCCCEFDDWRSPILL